MQSAKILAVIVFGLLTLVPSLMRAHCEIPCGIYDDQMRYNMLKEHITTIEKSMTQIEELSKEGDKNYNQLVRWVVNKENHATMFMDIVTQYFLTQRIKPISADAGENYTDYTTHLSLFHEMLYYAMKAKQSLDRAHVEKLRELVTKSQELYFK